uniref:DUF1350 domain-containing protein n=1 Tax=Araucaria cunninghamii TaxID=56994 RepID=A0A0D6R4U2_ARACU
MATINCISSPLYPRSLVRNSAPTLSSARIPVRSIKFSDARGFPYVGHHQNQHKPHRKKEGLLVLASNRYAQEDKEPRSIELYGQIERLITNTARQSQYGWGGTGNWEEIEGAWVLRPNRSNIYAVVHFVGGIFVGAAPQLTYRLFLERLSERGYLVIATPFASGFDHLRIADEVQFKFDRCIRILQDDVRDLPTFGVGHSLGTVIHLLIGARYAVQRTGNVFMSFNNKEASLAIPLFSPVIVPMAQSIGPILSQLTSSSTIRRGAEIALKQLEIMSPPLLKQVLPLVEQLPPLYMDLVRGREDFTPRPEETRRLVFPEVPSPMADAVTRGGELLANLAAGTPWETVAKEVGTTLSVDTGLRQQIIQDIDHLVDEISTWMMPYTRKMLP